MKSKSGQELVISVGDVVMRRQRKFSKRLTSVVVGALLVAGGGIGIPLFLTSGMASASANNHKLIDVQNHSGDVESAKVKFTNASFNGRSATGCSVSLNVKDINVVDSSGSSFADGDTNLTVKIGADTLEVPMSQSPKDGLWLVNATGTVPGSDCVSGSPFQISDADGDSAFLFTGVLS